MPNIMWIACPLCTKRYYIHEELANRDLMLFCPWCKKDFHSSDAKIIRNEFSILPANVTED